MSRPLPHDFEATIRIFMAKEGGRRTAAFNGIRWDFAYADDGPNPPMLYMIWPEFLASDGEPFADGIPLPKDEELVARMRILSDELRVEVHRQRIAVGVRFYCHEGGTRVAQGVVTRITGLFVTRTGGV